MGLRSCTGILRNVVHFTVTPSIKLLDLTQECRIKSLIATNITV